MTALSRSLYTLLSLALFCSIRAEAITIDDFQVTAELSSSTIAGTRDSMTTATSRALGGRRQLTVVQNSDNKGKTRLATDGTSLSFTLEQNQGEGIIVWDGDNDPTSLTHNGLGSIDLLRDGASAFIIPLIFFDLALGRPVQARVTLFDSSDGNKTSEVLVSIDQPWAEASPFMLNIPFSLFTTAGSSSIAGPASPFSTTTSFGVSGAASISNIGAISLHLVGDAADLSIGSIKTNGRCTSVPNTLGFVVDECGVCLESSDANKGKDACGICFFGPPGYDYNANKVFDACGVCYGDGSSCADCFGNPNGGGLLDQCGVCGGDGTSCLDCNGLPHGQSKVDACGVCGGVKVDPNSCGTVITPCAIVEASPDVRQFEKSLVTKAKALRGRYVGERRRATRAKCGINMAQSRLTTNESYLHITARSKQIFSAGVEVCGNSCITTSYAQQVEALKPYFNTIQKETVWLAKAVKKCYRRTGRATSSNGQRGVSDTVKDVNKGLRDLIERCRNQKVCPPGAK